MVSSGMNAIATRRAFCLCCQRLTACEVARFSREDVEVCSDCVEHHLNESDDLAGTGAPTSVEVAIDENLARRAHFALQA